MIYLFSQYQYLWLLLLVPLFPVAYGVTRRLRLHRIRKFGDEQLVRELMPSWSGSKGWIRVILFSLAFLFFVLGLARPQIGAKLSERKTKGAEVMIVLDVSNSMLAEDYSPNRLDRAKLAISRIVDKLQQDRIGLIVFAGTSFVQLPITTDYVSAKMFMNSISTESVPVQGTAIGEAILIMILGSGMISIMGDANQPALWDGKFLWFTVHMTDASFQKAWVIFFRAIAGVTLMLSFACSTPIPHLAHALRSIKCPPEICELIVLIYRYAFLLLERFLIMLDAAQCRLGYNGAMTAVKSYAGAMTGTFIFSLELAEKSEASLACRNYRGYFPIYRMPQKMGAKWFAITIILVVALYLIGRETAGWIDMTAIFAPYMGW